MVSAPTRRRIGVMGGTFDPIHVGHLIVAAQALHALNLTEVVFVPSANPWQKSPVASAADRLAMVRAATASEPKFHVSTVDIDRGGNTYTVDTLTDLRAANPDADFFLLLGSDALNGLHTWKDPERILSLAQVVCLARPGHEPHAQEIPASAVTLLEVPGIDVSSTDCRDRLRYGRPVRFMVTPPVLEYIENHELYRRDA
jgi:nicotinate-nucleotide adenylyltransferase